MQESRSVRGRRNQDSPSDEFIDRWRVRPRDELSTQHLIFHPPPQRGHSPLDQQFQVSEACIWMPEILLLKGELVVAVRGGVIHRPT